MTELTMDHVNALLRTVKDIMPGEDVEQELTLLTIALCIAARTHQIEEDVFLEQVRRCYVATHRREKTSLPGAH